MANLDLLENSIPVAPLKLAALPGSMEMASTAAARVSVPAKQKERSTNPSAVPIFTSWLMSATTASLTRSAATRTTCHRMTIIRI